MPRLATEFPALATELTHKPTFGNNRHQFPTTGNEWQPGTGGSVQHSGVVEHKGIVLRWAMGSGLSFSTSMNCSALRNTLTECNCNAQFCLLRGVAESTVGVGRATLSGPVEHDE